MNKFKQAVVFLLLIVGFTVLAETAANDENLPVISITREQINSIGIETAGQMIMFLGSKLPIPEGETPYQSIVDSIEQTDNKIIEDTGDYILVQSYNRNKETGVMEPGFKSRYFFQDGILTGGPVLDDPESMKGTKTTVKRLK